MTYSDEVVLQRAREIAIFTFCDAAAYIAYGVFDFESFNSDLDLARQTCSQIGFISMPDLFIAAFDIDEQILIVRIESRGQIISVEERSL